MERFIGKRAIITGGANGIGYAIASRLVDEGCQISIWDIDGGSAEVASRSLEKGAGNIIHVGVDVSDAEQVADAMAITQRHWQGAPDILVNNAGIGQLGSILEATGDEFDRTMAVNVRGTFNCSREAIPCMMEAGGGLILNVASWFGKSGRPKSLAYCASKFALIGMTQSMAIDLAPHGIRVNAVCPGTIDETKMREQADLASAKLGLPPAAEREHLIPLGRLGKPRDVANVVAFLLSDDADYMTGQSINVTGGLWMN